MTNWAMMTLSTGLALFTPVSASLAAETTPSDGGKTSSLSITIVRDGKETTITRHAEGGITVIYPGADGERVEVRAADEAELRRNPEAFEIYREYVGGENPRVRVWADVWRLPPLALGAGPRGNLEFNRAWAEELRRDAEQALRNSEQARARAREQAERVRQRLDVIRERNAQQPFTTDLNNPARQLGIRIDRADTALRTHLGDGVLVTGVDPNSRAQKMGLQPMDYIQRVNGTDITSPEQLRELIRTADGPLTIDLLRQGKPATIAEPAEDKPESTTR